MAGRNEKRELLEKLLKSPANRKLSLRELARLAGCGWELAAEVRDGRKPDRRCCLYYGAQQIVERRGKAEQLEEVILVVRKPNGRRKTIHVISYNS